MYKLLYIVIFCAFCFLEGREYTLSRKEMIYQNIILDINPNAPAPFFSNQTTDGYGRPYKRIVCTGKYSHSKERLNQGGGALAYYLNSFFCIKTGPSYAKGEGIDKLWKWSLQINWEYPVFPVK